MRRAARFYCIEIGALILPAYSQIELKDLKVAARIGTYGTGDVVPEAHLLDLTLTIAPDQIGRASCRERVLRLV